jgi:hypothetical protein
VCARIQRAPAVERELRGLDVRDSRFAMGFLEAVAHAVHDMRDDVDVLSQERVARVRSAAHWH